MTFRQRSFTKRRNGAALPLATLAALALAGCTGNTAAPAAPSAPSAPAASSGPVTPKVQKLAFGTTVPGTESNKPHIVCCTSFYQLSPMYEFLIGVSPEGKEMVPQLATEWNVEPDGKSFRFKLQKGIPFQNGKGEFSAKDVRFTWQDMKTEEEVFPPQPTGVARTQIQDVEVVGDQEVVIRLNVPNSGFLSAISQAESVFAMRSEADATARSKRPSIADQPYAGTGPYKFTERAQGQYIRFTRAFEKHWRQTPAFPDFEFRLFKEPSTMQAALLAREIQVAALPPDQIPAAEKAGMKIVAGKAPGLHAFVTFFGVWVNQRGNNDEQLNADPNAPFIYPNSPLMDVKVRKALAKAVDRDALNKAFVRGKGDPLYLEYFSADRPGWNPAWQQNFKDAYGYDPEASKKLLQEAGYGPGNPLKMSVYFRPYSYFPATGDLNEAVATYWRAVGVDVTLDQSDAATYASKSRRVDYDKMAYVVPTSIRQWLGPSIYNSFIGGCRCGVQLPELDRIYKEITVTLDPKRYEELWRQWGDLAYQNYVNIPLFWIPSEAAIDPAIVADYTFPGSISSTYTHVEYIKPAG